MNCPLIDTDVGDIAQKIFIIKGDRNFFETCQVEIRPKEKNGENHPHPLCNHLLQPWRANK